LELIKEITWTGKHVSLNDWYSNKHWTSRQKQKKDWYLFFSSLLGETIKLQTYKLEMKYNSRLDADNCIPMIKGLGDSMKERGWTIDDNKKYFKGFSIEPDESLDKGQYVIRIFGFRG
jgi:hypothetical protein